MKTTWPALLFGGLAIAFATWFGPTLARDLAMRGQTVRPAADAEIKKVHCRSVLFVITWCTITLDDRAGPRELRYALSGVAGRGRITAMRGEIRDDYVTTSLGREYLLNRSLTFLSWSSALLLLTWGGINYRRYHRDLLRRNT